MYRQDDNPYSFGLIESCADHIHWAGGFWKTEGLGVSRTKGTGGGHAHCGALIYLGDNWPSAYRNTFFTLNVHGGAASTTIRSKRAARASSLVIGPTFESE